MNKKFKLSVLSILTVVGLFAGGWNVPTASAMTCNSADITGRVTLNGNPEVHARFEYASTFAQVYNGSGTPTATQTFTSDGDALANLSGLSPNTTYFYRLVVTATNGAGTAYGAINTFTTPSCTQPPQICQDQTANNYGGALPCTYNPTGQAPHPNLTISRSVINAGESVSLFWAPTGNPKNCTAYDGSLGWGGYAKDVTGGSATFTNLTSPSDINFSLKCTNDFGSNTESRSVHINTTQTSTCQDTSATNYGGSLPCTYNQTQTCNDPSALNYRATGSCVYQQLCNDMNAINYHGGLPCVYQQSSNTSIPPINITNNNNNTNTNNNNNGGGGGGNISYSTCYDPSASNYGSVGNCVYYNNTQICRDSSASNYGGYGSCVYNNYTYNICQDPNANNYRGALPCRYLPIYNNPVNPISVYLTADNASVPYNGTTFIRWNSTNATTCYANGGSPGWAGAKSTGSASFYTGSLTTSYTYNIVCTNSAGQSANDSVTVSIRSQNNIITTNNTTARPAATSLVLITSSIDKNQPIVPTLDNTNPKPGDEINYTVTYQNVGNSSITNLNLRLDLPSEVSYMSSTPNNPTVSGNTLLFSLGTLRANGKGTVTAQVRVLENIPAGTNLNFPAVLSYIDPSGNPQSVNANVSAQVFTEPSPTQIGASVFNSGFLPTSFFGWLILLILVLILIALANHLYRQIAGPKVPQSPTASH